MRSQYLQKRDLAIARRQYLNRRRVRTVLLQRHGVATATPCLCRSGGDNCLTARSRDILRGNLPQYRSAKTL